MGSGLSTIRMAVDSLNNAGEKVGVLAMRLYRPFPVETFLKALPSTVKTIGVLDRTKEPGSNGEPLFQDVLTVMAEAYQYGKISQLPKMVAGRYGLSSKEFTPAMCKAVFDELAKAAPKPRFTVGIYDDVTNLSLDWDESYLIDSDKQVQCLFFGLGADGTVGANKNSIKIIGGLDKFFAQGYFVYDSKKSGSMTTSHLRFGPDPIDSPYLIQKASFIGCHQFNFVEITNVLANAAQGATLLLNSHYSKEEVWNQLPAKMQQQMVDLDIKFYVIDAYKVGEQTGMGQRVNTIMQTCFFALANVLPKEEAITLIKKSIEKTYMKKGPKVVEKNFAAVDATLANLFEVDYPKTVGSKGDRIGHINPNAPDFVRNITAQMMSGNGDRIPVSQIPDDGTYPTATTQWEKRDIARRIPDWREDLCIQCGNCSFICPHATIRAKFYHEDLFKDAPEGTKAAPITARGFPNTNYTLQVYPEDCTGCGLCVQSCPVRSPDEMDESGQPIRAINMVDKAPIFEREKKALEWYEKIPLNDRARVDFSTVRGVQFLEPLFEFSGACTGCGETPYLKLLTQLFGDRMMVANATGCSSIYGGNLPTTPWAVNPEGRGPAWANSLFEDNAEFGFGFRLSADKQMEQAKQTLETFRETLGNDLVDSILTTPQIEEVDIKAVREKVADVKDVLEKIPTAEAKNLLSLLDHLIRRSVWVVGGDGWAYDIGSSGVDHVLASGKNINVLVMDTEIYSNTGGQMSKSTPLGAVAKFASGGKLIAKKEVALQAISYGSVYVARIAAGANPQQALQALREAEAYDGPSLIIAYSHCIGQGLDMEQGLAQQRRAVDCGHWPLIRYNPVLRDQGRNPFSLDSLRPSIPLSEFRKHETRFQSLVRSHPEEAARLGNIAQHVVTRKWSVYEEMATRSASEYDPDTRKANL
jgi:pyruvate-ferredoxin/flavodoxin oxidoreductase